MSASASQSVTWSEEELKSKVGQLFIVGFHDHVPNEDIRSLITTYKIGSIVLFQRNVATAVQLLELTNSLQEIARSSGHDQSLFIGIDQENGLVTRIKAPIAAQLPGSMALGATGDPNNAFEVASATAATLASFGINMNYAPIADVNSEPKNPVIGVRSPSDDPETVGRFVSAQIAGLRQGGIVPCVKHFPGHGDTAVDSHYGLPVITKSRQSLDNCELVPFRRAVAQGVESIMTAHIALPGLSDPRPGEKLDEVPASLNPKAIDILRKEMKYEGVIISDCLEMDGVRATYGTEKGAVMALKAGTDCVMICHTIAAQIGAIELVIEAVKSGELSQEAIEASVQRVRKLKEKYLAPDPIIPTSSLAEMDSRIAEQTRLASIMYEKSTTLVRSEPGSLPLKAAPEAKIVFLSPGKAPLPGGAVDSGIEKTREPYTPSAYIDILRAEVPSAKDIRFLENVPLSTTEEKDIAEADAVIFATRNASLSAYQKDLGLALGKKLGSKMVVVATCDPYDFLEEVSEIKNYITIYEPTVPAFKAAVNFIFGKAKALGSLPVGTAINQHEVRIFDGSEKDITFVYDLYNKLFPQWAINRDLLTKLLNHPSGQHFVHEHGFCIAYLTNSGHGKITCVGVAEGHRNQGIGTELVTRAQEQLRGVAYMVGLGDLKSLGIGSVFPRFWPGVPIDFPQEVKEFFAHRGFQKHTTPTARDMYRDIRQEVAPAAVLDRVSKLDLTFAPLSPDKYEECITKQRANFKQIGWVQAYERLAAAGQHHEVMVAFLPDGSQVGWTLMCSASSVVGQDFAYLPLLPSGDKTGLIACVGVDASGRGKGVGLALLVKAMEDMRRRGMEGVCIDWVVIRGFYETLGFKPYWEYEGFDW
ncbi:hypothetical protein BP6252_12879 [Coleophoma cylindrospora]|uniref:N-acetyltransferase domain-containing protein n=1 Tax=Coleophoma cylindrospora TaxID=1849047 RepID=A0A3D8QD53_9HELO|nr:hypothetical protein BP6252_12879 [Coleophoma cylindrospora]